MTRKEIKLWAKEKVKGKNWSVLGMILLSTFVSSSLSAVPISNPFISIVYTLAVGLLGLFLQVGLIRFLTNFINDKESTIEILFSKFKDYSQVIKVYFHQYAIIFLYTLLLFIPGIIKALGYVLMPYIIADDSTIDSKDALSLSEDMMYGHKWEFFVFGLSFLGWHLLGFLTLGILELWIMPYQNVAQTKFLRNIMEEYKNKNKKVTA